MALLIWGSKGESSVLGYIFFNCTQCQRATICRVYQVNKRFTIYFIPTFAYDAKHVIVCLNCGKNYVAVKELKQQLAEGDILMSEERVNTLLAEAREKQRIDAPRQEPAALPASTDTRKCPFCAEEIKKEAIICRFCNRDLQ